MLIAEMEERLVGLEHEQFDALLVVTNCIDFAGISCLWLSPSCTGCRPGRAAKNDLLFYQYYFSNLIDV